MKKIKIVTAAIGLCMAASLFAGCNNQTGESVQVSRIDGGQTKISVENGGDNQMGDIFKFNYMGYDIRPGDEINPVVEHLGEPLEEPVEKAGCGGQGFFLTYQYLGFYIQTYKEDGKEIIYSIVIQESFIDFGGVHLGDTIETAKKNYGKPTSEYDGGIEYELDWLKLGFYVEAGTNTIEEIDILDNRVFF